MEGFFQQNQMYVVLTVVLMIWAGILVYLWRIERKVEKIENQMKKG
ncbi:MAG TPA: CcmD family protein [Bacteroidota bacterium]